MLKRLAESDDPQVRQRAATTLQIVQRARVQRVAAASMLHVAPPAQPIPPRKSRRVFDCQGTNDLTLSLAMNEGGAPSADVAVREAYDYAGVTWDFFQTLFNRNSSDDRGLTLVSSVHYSENGQGFDNAFWNGQQMIYGDGGELFGRMTQCLDVVAHELTHGVTQFSAGLPYELQSGALNEHFSDVFGVVVRQWHENDRDPSTANWLVGDKLMLDGHAIRSMKAPGTANPDDPQPAHMDAYQNLPNTEAGDHGGVHINSGIPNRAFYLAATSIGQPSWETAAKIWYITLTQRLKGAASFEKCALETISVARDFFDDATALKVTQAWKDVGVITSNVGPVASIAGVAPTAPVAPAAVVTAAAATPAPTTANATKAKVAKAAKTSPARSPRSKKRA